MRSYLFTWRMKVHSIGTMTWGAASLQAFLIYDSQTGALLVSHCFTTLIHKLHVGVQAASMIVPIWIPTSVFLNAVKCFITESAIKNSLKTVVHDQNLMRFILQSRREAEMSVLAAERLQDPSPGFPIRQLPERAAVSINMLKVKHPFCSLKSLIN